MPPSVGAVSSGSKRHSPKPPIGLFTHWMIHAPSRGLTQETTKRKVNEPNFFAPEALFRQPRRAHRHITANSCARASSPYRYDLHRFMGDTTLAPHRSLVHPTPSDSADLE